MPRHRHLLCWPGKINQTEVTRVALTPISRELHGKTRIRPISSFAFTAKETVVPIFGSEILLMSQEVPVVFLREADSFTINALLGVRAGQNLMLDPQGRWIGAHIPAAWRRGPFRLAQVAGEPADNPRLVLCIEDGSDQISETEGQPLFDESGAPSALISGATNLLSQMERDIRSTQAVCALLNEMGLIVPWPLDIVQPDGQTRRVADLFHIDESKIATLSGEDLVRLRDSGALAVIYAHLLSLSKIGLLGRLAKMAAEREQHQATLQKGNLNLDRAFGIVEDDPFIF
jgi:hypothetical protein